MIIITGGAGFIGSNILASLAEASFDVVVCDTIDSNQKLKNIEKHNASDLVTPKALFNYLDRKKNIDFIIHMGANSSTTENNIKKIFENNFNFSVNVWQFCSKKRIPLIYASSAATYGDGTRGFDDDISKVNLNRYVPLNLYGWSKHLFDQYALKMSKEKKSSPPFWSGFKFFNVYGPNEYHKGKMKSVVATIFPKVKKNETVNLFKSYNSKYKDGEQIRDFVYVKDCADVILWFINNRPKCSIFNIGTGRGRTFLDLARSVFSALNLKPKIKYIEMPTNVKNQYQYFTQAKIKQLRKVGYTRKFTSLEKGINDYVKNYLCTNDRFR